MEEKKQRRQYDHQFKAEAVRLVTQGGQRPTVVARELGITSKMLGQWRKQLERYPSAEQAFVGQGRDRDLEVARLRRRVAVLEAERDVLKKAIGIFVEPKR
jgi:transposase